MRAVDGYFFLDRVPKWRRRTKRTLTEVNGERATLAAAALSLHAWQRREAPVPRRGNNLLSESFVKHRGGGEVSGVAELNERAHVEIEPQRLSSRTACATDGPLIRGGRLAPCGLPPPHLAARSRTIASMPSSTGLTALEITATGFPLSLTTSLSPLLTLCQGTR
jgi:hypothetical protein